MSDSLDCELIALINRLNKIQKEIGGGKKDKGSRENGGDGKIDRFVDLSSQIKERIQIVTDTIEDIRKLEKVPGTNPRELISCQSKVRTEISAMSDEWKEMDSIYRLEMKKRRSKLTKEDLAQRQETLMNLQSEIQEIKEMQRAGYVKGYKAAKIVTIEQSEMFRMPKSNNTGEGKDDEIKPTTGVGARNNHMTDQQKLGLLQIKERDAKIDEEIDLIGQGVDRLGEIARAANEEVKKQNKMLDSLSQKIDDVHEHVTSINEQLKTTLEEARKSDKICVDIFCILLMIGMIIILVKVNADNQAKGK